MICGPYVPYRGIDSPNWVPRPVAETAARAVSPVLARPWPRRIRRRMAPEATRPFLRPIERFCIC